MPFTIEEVEQALITPRPEWPMYFPQNADRKKSVNYQVIMDYLTGKTTLFGSLQHDNEIYFWNTLINLLGNIENISANDQLVLDVINDPVMSPFMEQQLNHWLLLYLIANKTDSALQAVLQQFYKQGMNNDAVFDFILLNMHLAPEDEVDDDKEGYIHFLLDHIKQSPALVYPAQRYSSWGNDWSMFYFKLLEKAKPDFAEEYSLHSIYARENLAGFFTTYKKGKYLPGIVAAVTNQPNNGQHSIEPRFAFAIHLWEINEDGYKQMIVQMAKQYLDHFATNTPKQTWEQNAYLKEFEETTFSYLPFSAAAFHLLLKNEKDTALQVLNHWLTQKVFVHVRTLLVLEYHIKNEAFPFAARILKGDGPAPGVDYIRSIAAMFQEKFESVQYLPVIWALSNHKSKQVRELVATLVAEKDPDAETKAIGLLQNKNAEIRQTAATILGYFTSATAKEAVMKILHTETNDNARDILLQTIASSLPAAASTDFLNNTVAAAKSRGKLNKPVEAWLGEASLPPLFFTNGKELTTDEKRFLLYRMSRIKEMRSDMEARYVLQLLDKGRSSDFAIAIIKLYMDAAAKPEHKYLMALAALLGDDMVVDKIRITTNRWIEENRYKMAEHGVGALALHGSDKALRWVEWYSRKYKSKKANVGAAALQALESAAEELGITSHELGDRIVPDFGFDGLFKNFTAGGDEYRGFIDSNFKIAFFNEDNKKLKAIPATADASIKEEFKAIAKEVRDIVKSQSPRLEYYLIIQRRWTKTQWQQFFLQNPIMFIYATRILWGVFDKEGKLLQTFTCSEDTSLLNQENEEILLEEDGLIGIVHPSQLNKDLLQTWKKQFYDLSIESIFPQLERRLPDMKDIDLSRSIITKFDGKEMAASSTRSTLEKYGWQKGATGDGGMLDSFNLLYFEKRIEAILEVSGIGAGYGWGGEEKLGRFYITDKTKNTGRWFSYPKNDDDDQLVKLKDVPGIFLNEALAAIEAIKRVVKEAKTA